MGISRSWAMLDVRINKKDFEINAFKVVSLIYTYQENHHHWILEYSRKTLQLASEKFAPPFVIFSKVLFTYTVIYGHPWPRSRMAPERSSARSCSAHQRRFNEINMLRIEKSFWTNFPGIHTFHLIKKKKNRFFEKKEENLPIKNLLVLCKDRKDPL